MKIFFHAPITKRMKPIHDRYYEYIAELGHKHTTDFCYKLRWEDLYDKKVRREAIGFHKKLQLSVKAADVVVFGATEQSIGTGVFMYVAYMMSKPIVALCEDTDHIPFLYDALGYDKMLIYNCDTRNYRKVIPEALEAAAKLIDKRFTLLLPPDIVEMLERHYEVTGENRSEYIRNLIRSDQEGGRSTS